MSRSFDDFLAQNRYRMFVSGIYAVSLAAIGVALSGAASAWWLLAALVWAKLIMAFGNNIGMHRYFSHRSFDTTPGRARFLAWVSVLLGMGTVAQYAATHRLHHKVSDTANDIHSPANDGVWKTVLGLWELHETDWYLKRGKAAIRDVVTDPACKFVNRYYYRIWAVLVIATLLVSWKVTLFLLFLPSGIGHLSMNLFINCIGHRWGYRSFETNDFSTNSKLASVWTLGCSFQNNHHKYPGLYKFSLKKGEYDPTAWLIEKFFAVPGPATERGRMRAAELATPQQAQSARA